VRLVNAADIAVIITAVATGITAIGGLVLAFAVLIPTLRAARETHHLVNQTRTDMLRREEVLIAALQAGGIAIPPDQSLARLTPGEAAAAEAPSTREERS
jgi:hypothetical protein